MTPQIGAGIVGLVAVIYGFAVAFGPRMHDNAKFWRSFTVGGGLAVLVLAIMLIVLPWLGLY